MCTLAVCCDTVAPTELEADALAEADESPYPVLGRCALTELEADALAEAEESSSRRSLTASKELPSCGSLSTRPAMQRTAPSAGCVVNGMKWVLRHYYHQERGVPVFLGAGNFSQGGWKAGAVREGFRRVVQQPSRPSTDPRPDRLVIMDEFRTSRVSSSVHARQPCELHLPPDRPRPADWVPPAGQVNPRLVRPAWSQRHAKYVRGLSWCHQVPPNHPPPPPAQAPPAQAPPPPLPAQATPLPASPGPGQRPQAPPWGRWLDRDTDRYLNLQRIGESRQRPIELCQWDDLEALPPVGKEYQQGYKRVNDRLPKVKQRLHRAAEYRRGIDGRAGNNA
ncbi:hypothetical protein QJQ45_011922 [Haematococcus lacustris]|nr:hypothetical protein QJQ45_011922 [Haematococcus lacustris]